MPTDRKPIAKKIRFEVFKRDSFTCQYCGRMAPDVVLHIDHINPIKNGGDNDILNLTTSCVDCNLGKGARKLTDSQEIQKQQEQLRLLSQKKEQLELMVQWREELLSFSESEVDIAEAEMLKFSEEYTLSDVGRRNTKDLIKRFSLPAVLDAIAISYPRYNTGNTIASWNKAFNALGGICHNKKMEREDPTFSFRQRAYFSFKKSFSYHSEGRVKNIIRRIVKDEKTLSLFFDIVDESRYLSDFYESTDLYGDE